MKKLLILFVRITRVIWCFRALQYAGQAELLRAHLPPIYYLVKLLLLLLFNLRGLILVKETTLDARVHLEVREGTCLVTQGVPMALT